MTMGGWKGTPGSFGLLAPRRGTLAPRRRWGTGGSPLIILGGRGKVSSPSSALRQLIKGLFGAVIVAPGRTPWNVGSLSKVGNAGSPSCFSFSRLNADAAIRQRLLCTRLAFCAGLSLSHPPPTLLFFCVPLALSIEGNSEASHGKR